MDRRAFSVALATGAAASLVGTRTSAEPQMSAARVSGKRNVVLIHGAYADGSSWSGVINRLQAAGVNATAVQNPLTSFADDVAATRRALAIQRVPTVLVAHSYGGMVLSETGVDPNVTALVYIAARAPDAAENYAALAAKYPTAPAGAGLVTTGDFSQLNKMAFLQDFANGVPAAKADELYAVQSPIAATLFAGAMTTVAAWRSKPSWYAVSKHDRTIDPDLERFMAKRMNAKTVEIDAGHLSLVSHPDDVANLILAAIAHGS